jgi:predicted RNA-binding Zn ribbon-like protein
MPSISQSFAPDSFGLRYMWIDLVNSQELDGFGNATDHLANPRWVVGFLRHWGFDPALARRVPRTTLAALRSVLRRVAGALARGRRPAPADLGALNATLRQPATRRLSASARRYGLALEPVRGGWRWVEAQVAASLGEMLVHEPARRLKICPNPGCAWVFFDETKGNTRRWCSDRTCGNRAKVRRFRARRRKRLRKA